MTPHRDPDRLIHAFLLEGDDQLQDRVYDAVRAEIDHKRQRAVLGPWRAPTMNRILTFGFGIAAAAAIVLLVNLRLSGSPANLGVPAEEPSVDLGTLQPVAGRIVYGDRDGIWGVDPAAPGDPATRVQLAPETGIPLGWTSDGTRLLIARQSPGEPGHLFVLNADGSETQLTERPMPIAGAAISPDGSRVVFAADGMYIVDADGGVVERLFEPGEHLVQQPIFSPDGTQIAYAIGGGDHSNSVWLMDVDGTDASAIFTNESDEWPGHVRGLAWSPAGDRLALALGTTIYTFASDGSGFTPVISRGTRPYWSPDGSQLAYTITNPGASAPCADEPEGCSLAIADADGSNVREFGFGASGPWHPGAPESGAGS